MDPDDDVLGQFARLAMNPVAGPFASARKRIEQTAAKARDAGTAVIIHVGGREDHSAAWDRYFLERENELEVIEFNAEKRTSQAAPARTTVAAGRGQRSRKSLQSVASFGAYQREWFAEVRERAVGGEPFAVVNANAPMEILRAFGIDYVVNQWWASIVAAKQQSVRYNDLLEANHLPGNLEGYSSMGLAAAFDDESSLKPWGGLPKPTLLQAVVSSDATPKLFETWAAATGSKLQLFERSLDTRSELPLEWWDVLHDDWDVALQPERLDLMAAEFRTAIREIENWTGRRFDQDKFLEILDLVNEQEEYFRRTRELIASTYPVPASAVDMLPATMVPQWQRGTIWGRDAARAVFEEVSARAQADYAASPHEKIRLMFIGRGMWSDMGFYQRWEESHGAVFVWTMYLALAADGYIRRHDKGRDPMRALAARFTTVGDEMRLPGWAGAWHVKEAVKHGVHGAVALSDADAFVITALRQANIPVLELSVDNYFRAPEDEERIDRKMEEFLTSLAT